MTSIVGPNFGAKVSRNNGTGGDQNLTGLARQLSGDQTVTTLDASVLEFDFVPDKDRSTGVAFGRGQAISEQPDVERFLGAVRSYYLARRAAERECAFDFKLAWRTDRDFRVAKKTFEPYFYPAGDRQLQ